MAKTLAAILIVLVVVLLSVSAAGVAALQSSVSTNTRLDRNLVYLNCSFNHIQDNQTRILKSQPVLPTPCKASSRK